MSTAIAPASACYLPPQASHHMYTLPLRRVRDVLAQVVPDVKLTTVEDIPSTRLPRLYTLNLSDESTLLLSFAPSLTTRLLRQEQTLLSSEATLVHLLAAMVHRENQGDCPPSLATSPSQDDASGGGLGSLVPRLLKHSSNTREMGYPYTIYEPVVGVPLSSLSIYLSIPERRRIDNQMGVLVRDLAQITSPSGTFGSVTRVCPNPFPHGPNPRGAAAEGSPTWHAAFMTLVEGILRDGEDMSVLLPYGILRHHFTRLSWQFNAVTTARLLVLDIGDEANVMVQRATEDAQLTTDERIKITGLRDWSQGFFGDPLLASCFENPSEAFMAGWKADGDEDLMDDPEGAHARILLYGCYRAVVSIVAEYYRPQADSSRRELNGRRKLTTALAEIEKMDIESGDLVKRARRDSVPGNDTSKRQKTDSGLA